MGTHVHPCRCMNRFPAVVTISIIIHSHSCARKKIQHQVRQMHGQIWQAGVHYRHAQNLLFLSNLSFQLHVLQINKYDAHGQRAASDQYIVRSSRSGLIRARACCFRLTTTAQRTPIGEVAYASGQFYLCRPRTTHATTNYAMRKHRSSSCLP
jgi:hypothetical protein